MKRLEKTGYENGQTFTCIKFSYPFFVLCDRDHSTAHGDTSHLSFQVFKGVFPIVLTGK